MADVTEAGLPRVLAVAWGMHEAPVRGPKRELSHEAIVEAAIELADAGGLAGVTMAKVAEALGFTTMSLYRYVASKDELIALMQDTVANEPEVPAVDADDWRRGLRDFAAMQRALYADHPWVLDVPLSLTNVLMPNNVKFADAAYRAMRTLPAGTDVKQAVLLSLSMFVRVFGQLERDIAAAGPDAELGPLALQALAEVITPERFPDLAPVLVTGGYTGDPPGGGDAMDDFELGLQLLLDGLGAWTAAHPAPGRDGPGQVGVRPPDPVALAERELAAATALRKQAQARVKDLERRERDAVRARDRARKAQQQG
jgi:AcrR family transcriptional regulator